MTAAIHWFLPTSGDGRTVVGSSHAATTPGTARAFRAPTRAVSPPSTSPFILTSPITPTTVIHVTLGPGRATSSGESGM